MSVERCAWPLSRLGEALETLARKCGLAPRALPASRLAETAEDLEQLPLVIDALAAALGLEVEPVEATHAGLDQLLLHSHPSLLAVRIQGEPALLALVRARRNTLIALGPDLALHRLPLAAVQSLVAHDLEAPLQASIQELLEEAGVPRPRRERSRAAILRGQLAQQPIGRCWLLRLPPGASAWQQAQHARLPRRLCLLIGAHAAASVLWLWSWWMVGRGALQDHLDPGWLLAWGLILLTMIPFHLALTSMAGRLAIDAGAVLKRRLLAGVLRLEPEEIRHQGVGQLLGCVIESEAVESLAISGGLLGLVAIVEIVLAAAVLSWGSGTLLALMLSVWVAFALTAAVRYARRRRVWTDARLALTNDLVANMVGHRTRLAQEDPRRWHVGEDQALERYQHLSHLMDRAAVPLLALVPRGWLVVSLLGLTPEFCAGHIAAPALAASLGGILLAYRALLKLVQGVADLAGAKIAWQQVASLFKAASRPQLARSFVVPLAAHDRTRRDGHPIIDAQDLAFRYRDRGEPVLRGCSLRIAAGDRLLLEGPSGSGKSTLCSLLTGLRLPESGLLLLHGLDQRTLGADGWRRRVVAAPQFHENHILGNTLAFNLLMGRGWPPTRDDLAEAEAVCQDLGLGRLLERMPSGLQQMVGETGWQLSHGERSRVYIARALLQQAELILLDESFAALDPETLQRVMQCVLARARTLLVIAHP